MSEKNVPTRRGGLQVMARLVGLVRPLAGFMALAILMGLVGHLCASAITVLAGYGLLGVLGDAAGLPLGVVIAVMAACAVARGIVEDNERRHIEGVPEYRLLDEAWFLDTFERVNALLLEGLRAYASAAR